MVYVSPNMKTIMNISKCMYSKFSVLQCQHWCQAALQLNGPQFVLHAFSCGIKTQPQRRLKLVSMAPEKRTKVFLPLCAQNRNSIRTIWNSCWQIVYGQHVIRGVFTILTPLKLQPSCGIMNTNAGDPSLTVYVSEAA